MIHKFRKNIFDYLGNSLKSNFPKVQETIILPLMTQFIMMKILRVTQETSFQAHNHQRKSVLYSLLSNPRKTSKLIVKEQKELDLFKVWYMITIPLIISYSFNKFSNIHNHITRSSARLTFMFGTFQIRKKSVTRF